MRGFANASLFALLCVCATSQAETVFVKWDKGKSDRGVVAFDLTARNILWEAKPCWIPNFAEKTSGGVLTGCDDGQVAMLDPATGKEIWKRSVMDGLAPGSARPEKLIKVNRYHGEKADGFFVSTSDEVYLLIGKRGEYLMRCNRAGCESAPK